MDQEKNKELLTRWERIAERLDASRIAEYVELMNKPRKLIWTSFVAGIARGLGAAVGATVVFALVLEVLRRLIVVNVLGIGDFIVSILKVIEAKQGGF
ncbi:MAG: hypothetical protein IIV08_00805 [Selenomonadales bacterium]|jgi:hypothetical protein|nr:hypothetical protein [Selenomonadales bacterium]MBQ5636077.1 hypothetical protein [Selenomonadales bacterium]